MKRRSSDVELNAYVDGELPESKAKEIDCLMGQDELAAKKVRGYYELNVLLRKKFKPISRDSDLHLNVCISNSVNFIYAATLACVISFSVFSGWQLNQLVRQHEHYAMTNLVEPAAFAHYVYASDEQFPVEIKADQEEVLEQWVIRRMNRDLKAPDLKSMGLVLVGGRLLPSSDRMAVQYMYEDEEGQRTTIYIRKFGQSNYTENNLHVAEQRDFHVLYWTNNELGFAVTGSSKGENLSFIANSIRSKYQTEKS